MYPRHKEEQRQSSIIFAGAVRMKLTIAAIALD
jgi:hypothetical protein